MPRPRRRSPSWDARLTAGFSAIRTEHDVPVEFPAQALEEAQEAVRTGPADVAGRTDLTQVPFWTVDPPGSMDLDQAMHLERRGAGFRVRYAIADVAAFVRPGGALDTATHQRVETVYCPDVRVPLHPPVLGEGAASLLPGVVRPALVWVVDVDGSGEPTGHDLVRASVRSVARTDYAGEQARLDAGVDTDDQVALLAEVGALLAAQERARGGVSLARPEQEVVSTPAGGWDVVFRAPVALEDHNAQISLLAGRMAARTMLDAGTGVLRTMPAADAQAVSRLRRQALALDVPWPDDATYGDVLASVDHRRPEVAAFLAAATSLFRGAAWTPFDGEPPEQTVHSAIAAPYAHVTAPLRRLVDRYGLEVCAAAHAGVDVPGWVRDALDGLGGTMATGARRGSAVDRACTDLVEAAVLAPRVGEVFPGVALDDRTVQLRRPAVVARTTGGDLEAGSRVQVRLVRADLRERRVEFEQVS